MTDHPVSGLFLFLVVPAVRPLYYILWIYENYLS